MSGYCNDCGNTQCLCKEIEQQEKPTSSCMVDSVVGYMDEYLKDKVFAVYDDGDIATQVVRYDDVVKLVTSLVPNAQNQALLLARQGLHSFVGLV